ncbi:hypothetical protein VKT23_012337 [Stygiomarasmius scandens]|uniref:CCHC-type domain-containing protein n=1 Tax=Marasmiellus scandens TaxID=2682957 RepID=A0ABR1J7F9_9AGAR
MPEAPASTSPPQGLTPEVLSQIQSDKLPKKSKTPPVFNGEDPDTLFDWIEDVEEIFETSGVTQDKAKIELALKWMKRATSREMKQLPSASGSSWDAFKKDLQGCYPETAASAKGSKAKLKSIVEKHRLVPYGSIDKMLAYNRAFKLEAKKLLEPPALISDPEAVELYLRGLEDKLVEEIYREVRRSPEDTTERRLEAPFTLAEIIAAAETVALKYAGRPAPRSSIKRYEETHSLPSSEKRRKSEENSEYESKLSRVLDTLQLTSRHLEESTTANIRKQDQVLEVLNKIARGGMSSGGIASVSTMARASQRQYRCYICDDPEHLVRGCPDYQRFIQEGWIKRDGAGLIIYKDGVLVPESSLGESRKDKILKYVKAKGWDKKIASSNILMEVDDPEEAQLQKEYCTVFQQETLPQTQAGMSSAGTTSSFTEINSRLDKLESNREKDSETLEILKASALNTQAFISGLKTVQSGN